MLNKKLPIYISMTVILFGCNASQIQAYINLVVQIGLQIATLAGAPASASAKVSSDMASLNKLISDYSVADSSSKQGKLAEINSLLTVAETDVTDIANLTSVKDAKKISTIRAALNVAIIAIESIRAIESKGVSTNPVKLARTRISTPQELKNLYNLAVSDYPEARVN